MLVRPFQIEAGAHALAIARLHHKCVGRAAVEPDVEDVVHHLIIGRVMARPKPRLMIGREPGVLAALAERVAGAGVEGTTEERRVGKEGGCSCGYTWVAGHLKKKKEEK